MHIADNFDPEQFHPLVVAERTDGTMWVIDGGNRLQALLLLKWEDQQVPCLVRSTDALQAEAHGFIVKNEVKRLTALHMFTAGITAAYKDECEIAQVCHELGLEIKSGRTTGAVGAVMALRKVYAPQGSKGVKNRTLLRDVLRVLRDAWEGAPDGFDALLIKAVATLLQRESDAPVKFQSELAARLGGKNPRDILALGRAARDSVMMGKPLHVAVAEVIVNLYNAGRRTQVLRSLAA